MKSICAVESVACFNDPTCVQEVTSKIKKGEMDISYATSIENVGVWRNDYGQQLMRCVIRAQCGAPDVCCGCTDRGDWKNDPWYNLYASPSSGSTATPGAKGAGAIAGGVIGGLVLIGVIVFVVVAMSGNSDKAQNRALHNPPVRAAVENAAYDVPPIGPTGGPATASYGAAPAPTLPTLPGMPPASVPYSAAPPLPTFPGMPPATSGYPPPATSGYPPPAAPAALYPPPIAAAAPFAAAPGPFAPLPSGPATADMGASEA